MLINGSANTMNSVRIQLFAILLAAGCGLARA